MPPGRVLLTQTQIAARVRELGGSVAGNYRKRLPRGERLLVLGVMNGALFFMADLLRATDLDQLEIATVRLASYTGTQSGSLRGLSALKKSFRGRHVLIVDDILDTGRTLAALTARLKKLGAADIKICVLLEKRVKRKVSIKANWIGFRIADQFVVGYGLDHDGRHRTLRQIRVLAGV